MPARDGYRRFIPTYMGNAQNPCVKPYSLAVHPHVHGERALERHICDNVAGSSPRTWGTLRERPLITPLNRFIPTYMGNAGQRHLFPSMQSVHPHVHGERIGVFRHDGSLYGSSPRTWGTQHPHERRQRSHRFIPTYMGNAPLSWPMGVVPAVHPHVHGERLWVQAEGAVYSGSSPRTWGTHNPGRRDPDGDRFIPTYMGNAYPTMWLE